MFSCLRPTAEAETRTPKLTGQKACVLTGIRQRLLLRRHPKSAAAPTALNLILMEIKQMSDLLDSELSKLRADVAAQNTVIASATAAFQGLAAQLVAAEAAAKNAGATDVQVSGVTTLRQQLEANTAALAAAIPANTDAAAPAPASDPTIPATPSAPASDPASAAAAPVTAPAAVAMPDSSSVAADAPAATPSASVGTTPASPAPNPAG